MAWMDTETGDAFEKALRELWQQAAHMGFAVGEDARWDREQEVAQKLEEERVWGFDVGWKLCSEQQQLRASQASLIPPSHTFPHSLSVAATQTDNVAVTPVIPAAAATAAPAPAPTPAPLDWAEDAATLPIFPLHSTPPPSTPRDFSALPTPLTLAATSAFVTTKSGAAAQFHPSTSTKIRRSLFNNPKNTIIVMFTTVYSLPRPDFVSAVRQTSR
ncbi:hypothetical protein B0H17DRAFT_1191893 [Mycena rosella]|uniref:Uncharacterized protein n=1 Tax=Mycena rosella TaxID=1033263 RepID=A0AAD7MA42_MYCRO|nr:hypothetical protein B0H17DRAFT_1191893 [Mycena rosella]